MFGFFKKKPDHIDRLQAVMELGAEFPRLQNDAPAAAWFFARNLVNARPLIDLHAPIQSKLDHLHAELRSQGTETSTKVDAGMSACALQTLVGYMRALQRRENEMIWSATLKTIMQHGERYRELSPLDEQPHPNPTAQAILERGGNRSLAELIETVEAEAAANSDPAEDSGESIQTIIASFDIREEAASGRLWPHIVRMREIIGRV